MGWEGNRGVGRKQEGEKETGGCEGNMGVRGNRA